VDLTAVPSVNTQTVQDFIGEVGPDLSRFPSASAFSSWMTVCPHNEISGGKKLRAKTRKSNSRAAKAFRLAAQSLAHSDSALGDFYRRIASQIRTSQGYHRHSSQTRRIAFHMVTTGEPYDESVFAKAERKHRTRAQENRLEKPNAAQARFQNLVPIQQSYWKIFASLHERWFP
jgi:hypothetical protein